MGNADGGVRLRCFDCRGLRAGRLIGTTKAQFPARRIITVKAGGDLQAAVRSAKYGDTIELEAGRVFCRSNHPSLQRCGLRN
jgi:hypothetical protein